MNITGLMVARLQPLHSGHCMIINKMIQDCHTVIIGLGSTQLNKQKDNPWNVEERMQMIKNVYGERVRIVPLKDLGTEPGRSAWCEYVLDKITKLGLPEPTDYFTGSMSDSVWYKDHFWPDNLTDLQTKDSDLRNQYRTSDGDYRILHNLKRFDNEYPPATEIRQFLETRDEGWRHWVPKVNHDIVEIGYPSKFRVSL